MIFFNFGIEHTMYVFFLIFHRCPYLVGGLEHFLFFHILGMSSSQLTSIFFRGVGRKTTNQIIINHH